MYINTLHHPLIEYINYKYIYFFGVKVLWATLILSLNNIHSARSLFPV